MYNGLPPSNSNGSQAKIWSIVSPLMINPIICTEKNLVNKIRKTLRGILISTQYFSDRILGIIFRSFLFDLVGLSSHFSVEVVKWKKMAAAKYEPLSFRGYIMIKKFPRKKICVTKIGVLKKKVAQNRRMEPKDGSYDSFTLAILT